MWLTIDRPQIIDGVRPPGTWRQTVTIRISLVLVLVAVGGPAKAGAQPDESLAQCAQVQPVVQKLIGDASRRLEEARQTNSATAMRAALDDVEGVLRDLRAQLVPCAKTQVTDPHAGHAAPAANQPPAPATKPAATPTPAKPPAASDSRVGTMPPTPATEAVTPTPAKDPVCGMTVDPASAPSTQHAGHTYYFCSVEHHRLFQDNPTKYVPKGQ